MRDLTKIPYCIDCGSPERKVYWGGGPRCQPCSDRFGAEVLANKARRLARERAALEAHRAAGCPDDGILCSDCCEHSGDRDHGICCDCETDLNDVMADAAHAACEGER